MEIRTSEKVFYHQVCLRVKPISSIRRVIVRQSTFWQVLLKITVLRVKTKTLRRTIFWPHPLF